MLNDWKARLWCRFFLLSVLSRCISTTILRGSMQQLVLDAWYDIYVIKKTNETAAQVFPVMLCGESGFYARLDVCVRIEKLSAIANSDTPKPPSGCLLHLEWLAVPAFTCKPLQWLRIKAGTLINSFSVRWFTVQATFLGRFEPPLRRRGLACSSLR